MIHSDTDAHKTSFFIAAPIDIDGKTNVVTVLVRRDPNTQRMYLHSVILKEYLPTKGVSAADAPGGTSEPHGSKTRPGDIANILGGIISNDPTTVSKVVDANGVPMVVYHGTNGNFDGFAPYEALGGGMFFSPDPREASAFANARGANVMPVFLSVKNLRQGVVRSYDEVRAIGRAKERGQDGCE